MFLQPDWFEVTQPGVGTNRYSYSFNDPVNLSDSSGNAVPLVVPVALWILGIGGAEVASDLVTDGEIDGDGLIIGSVKNVGGAIEGLFEEEYDYGPSIVTNSEEDGEVGQDGNRTLPPGIPEIAPDGKPVQPAAEGTRGLPIDGPPDTWVVGPRQDRLYGPDGRPVKDVDYGHAHGQPRPHVQEWDPDNFPSRGIGREPEEGETFSSGGRRDDGTIKPEDWGRE